MSGIPTPKATMIPSLDLEPGYKKVARVIQHEIFSGALKAGELLPTEHEMAEQLGVNRSTVREGIRSLENAGMVRRGSAKRLEVAIPGNSVVGSAVANALGLRQVSFLELWEMQIQLEPFAARLAATRITDPLRVELQKNVAELRRHLGQDDLVVLSDMDFHRIVAEAAGNSALILSAAPIGALLYSATLNLYADLPQARFRLLEAHEAIMAAILRGDAGEAEVWMLRHIEDFRRGYEICGIDVHAPLPLDFQLVAAGLS